MKKLLSLLGSVGMIGTAGATVVACGNKTKDDKPKPTTKEQLEALVKDAWNLVDTSSKSKEATTTLKIAIEHAEGALKEEILSPNIGNSLEPEIVALNEAIKTFKGTVDAVIDAQLENTIVHAKETKDKLNKSPQAKDILKNAIDKAEKYGKTHDDSPSKKDIINTLRQAIVVFRASPEVTVNYTKLTETIIAAEKAIEDNGSRNADAEATLNNAIAIAKEIVYEGSSTQIEVDETVAILSTAITIFQKATESDYSQLQVKIEEAEKVISETREPKPGTKETLTEAIVGAKEVIKEANSSQEEVDFYVTELDEEIHAFKDANR